MARHTTQMVCCCRKPWREFAEKRWRIVLVKIRAGGETIGFGPGLLKPEGEVRTSSLIQTRFFLPLSWGRGNLCGQLDIAGPLRVSSQIERLGDFSPDPSLSATRSVFFSSNVPVVCSDGSS